jgi:hypothetical protein
MSRGVLVSISAYSIAILLVISGFFLLDIDRNALYLCAFGSLLFSLVISLISTVILVSNKNAKAVLFFNAGFGSVIGIYQVMVIISILFINSFKHHIGAFVFLEIVFFGVFIVVSIIFHVSSQHIYEGDKNLQDQLENGEFIKPKRGGF